MKITGIPSGLSLLHLASLALAALVSSAASARVAGDECSNAIPAVLGANAALNTATMTASANPPSDLDCSLLDWTASTKDAWWYFDAPHAGMITIDFCPSSYDTSVVIYQGDCGALVRIGCDDDGCGPSFQSRIDRLDVSAGRVYIRVGGYQGATGTVQFNLSYEAIGAVRSWGSHWNGSVQPPADLGLVRRVTTDDGATIALRANGLLRAWNSHFTATHHTHPAGVGALSAFDIGDRHGVGVTTAGFAVCWGSNDKGQCSIPAGLGALHDIRAGFEHTLALRQNGLVAAWGDNYDGESTVPAGLGAVRAIAAGYASSVVLKQNGSLGLFGAYSWTSVPSGTDFIAIAASPNGAAFLALRASGAVVGWGSDSYGQLQAPWQMPPAVAIAVGDSRAAAILADGSLVGWGGTLPGTSHTSPDDLGPVTGVACGSGFFAAISTGDCNENGVFDPMERVAFDCDGNGIHDCYDIRLFRMEDCNGNSIGDECEKQLTVSKTIGPVGPIGYLSPWSWSVEDAVAAVEPVTMRVRGSGDFSGALEFVQLRVGNLFEVDALAGTGDCTQSPAWITYTLTPDEFNSGIAADGTWRLDMIASSAVNANLCTPASWIEVKIDYTGAKPSDCDANGELDSCQIAAGTVPDTNGNGVIDTCETPLTACPTDADGNGATGATDLGALLGAWGTVNANFDFNADGVVGAQDLAVLLAAWGPCPEA
ncbi:MAG: hypothetical protein LW636_11105 [Planctomycetaceae bacterium]|nr:hypothetical protein [Planctomycetaceae bacterium]